MLTSQGLTSSELSEDRPPRKGLGFPFPSPPPGGDDMFASRLYGPARQPELRGKNKKTHPGLLCSYTPSSFFKIATSACFIMYVSVQYKITRYISIRYMLNFFFLLMECKIQNLSGPLRCTQQCRVTTDTTATAAEMHPLPCLYRPHRLPKFFHF